jgi:hypothetical protein
VTANPPPVQERAIPPKQECVCLVDEDIHNIKALMNCGHYIHTECLVSNCKGLGHGKRPTCQKERGGAEIDSIQIESVFQRLAENA